MPQIINKLKKINIISFILYFSILHVNIYVIFIDLYIFYYYFIYIFLLLLIIVTKLLIYFLFSNRDEDDDDYPGSFEAELATMDEMEDEFGNTMSQVIEEVYT